MIQVCKCSVDKIIKWFLFGRVYNMIPTQQWRQEKGKKKLKNNGSTTQQHRPYL